MVERIRTAERHRDEYDDANRYQRETFQTEKAAMTERIRDLERVAKAVRSITADIVESGRPCSDCPYVDEDEARELLAIIDGAKK